MRIRPDVSVLILMLLLVGYVRPTRGLAQQSTVGEEGADQYRYSMAVVKAVLAQPNGMHNTFVENPLARLGDSASVAVIKLVPEKQMEDPLLASRIVHIIQMAFARPCIIDLDVDKTPGATLLLIHSLQLHVKDTQLRHRLKELTKAVTAGSSEECRDAVE